MSSSSFMISQLFYLEHSLPFSVSGIFHYCQLQNYVEKKKISTPSHVCSVFMWPGAPSVKRLPLGTEFQFQASDQYTSTFSCSVRQAGESGQMPSSTSHRCDTRGIQGPLWNILHIFSPKLLTDDQHEDCHQRIQFYKHLATFCLELFSYMIMIVKESGLQTYTFLLTEHFEWKSWTNVFPGKG